MTSRISFTIQNIFSLVKPVTNYDPDLTIVKIAYKQARSIKMITIITDNMRSFNLKDILSLCGNLCHFYSVSFCFCSFIFVCVCSAGK